MASYTVATDNHYHTYIIVYTIMASYTVATDSHYHTYIIVIHNNG